MTAASPLSDLHTAQRATAIQPVVRLVDAPAPDFAGWLERYAERILQLEGITLPSTTTPPAAGYP